MLKKLETLDEQNRLDALCELNVKEQVTNVCNTPVVQKAWNEGQELSVHGWIYSIENGLLRDLVHRMKQLRLNRLAGIPKAPAASRNQNGRASRHTRPVRDVQNPGLLHILHPAGC